MPTFRLMCPLPHVSSSRKTLPGPLRRTSPSLVAPSISPARTKANWRRGAGCNGPSHPTGKLRKSRLVLGIAEDKSTGGAGGGELGEGHLDGDVFAMRFTVLVGVDTTVVHILPPLQSRACPAAHTGSEGVTCPDMPGYARIIAPPLASHDATSRPHSQVGRERNEPGGPV